MKVALIESKITGRDYSSDLPDIDYDKFSLCSDPSVKKVLKSNVDIEINTDDYDWVILVGSEACKHFTRITSVMEYSGKLVDSKFLPLINPGMLGFKPELRQHWINATKNVVEYISGEKKEFIIDSSVVTGIRDSKEANEYFKAAIDYDDTHIGLDSETTGLYPRNGHMLGLSLCYDGKTSAYIDCDCLNEESEELLQELFNKKSVIFHNAKFDIAFFEYHFNFKFPRFEDTMLLHYVIDENPGTHGLKQLALKYTQFGDYEKPMYDWIADFKRKNSLNAANFRWEYIPFDVMMPYAAVDALATFTLFRKFEKVLNNKKLANVYHNILIPGCRFLLDVQDNGVPFDRKRLNHSQELMEQEIEASIKKLYEYDSVKAFESDMEAPFNPNSPIQLRKLLFDYEGLQPTGKKTEKGAISTDAEVLKELSQHSPIPQIILDIKQKTKIKNTYLDKIIPQLDRDSRLRTNFNLHGTTSGRLSSSGKMNMQQLPRDNPIVKGCIVAKEGHVLVAMDLTTAEVYVASVLANDEALQNVFKSGGDFHSTIAKEVFALPCPVEDVKAKFSIERQAAKAVSFGIMYGAQKWKISETVTKESGEYFSPERAQEVIDQYFKKFRKLKKWIEANIESIKENGYIYSAFGRKRRLPEVMIDEKGKKDHAVRSGLNFLVQSVASDINLLGAIETNDYIKAHKMGARIFALVHDSILAEVPEDEVDRYTEVLLECVQRDRGVSIKGQPIGCDVDVHKDYSLGKFEAKYEQFIN